MSHSFIKRSAEPDAMAFCIRANENIGCIWASIDLESVKPPIS